MAGVLDRSVKVPVVGEAPVIPVGLIVSGLYLCWFGVHYWGSDTKWPTDPIKAILTGKPIPVPDRTATNQSLKDIQAAAHLGTAAGTALANSPASQGAGAVGAGGRIAEAASRYQGAGYVFGGPADAPGNWDCSSFVSYVLGHDLGMKLPGGGTYGASGFPPHAHGPTTFEYMLFGAPVTQSKALPGDLVVSSEHMGIVTDPAAGTYMSAHSPRTGTGTGNYLANFPGGAPVFRRVT